MNRVFTNPPPPLFHYLLDYPPQIQPSYTDESILELINSKSTPLSQIHAVILKTGYFHDHFVTGALLRSYATNPKGSLDDALKFFNQVPSQNDFAYNVLINACANGNKPRTAMSLYCQMVVNDDAKPDKYTYPPLFKACKNYSEAMQVHGHVVKLGLCDEHIKSAGIRMYGRFGKVDDARNFLDDDCNVVCWNALIDVCFKCGEVETAAKAFDEMPERNMWSWNAAVNGLAKCRKLKEARIVFDQMKERDEITWSSLIDGYINGGFYKEALEVFKLMRKEGAELSRFALTSVLSACAHLGALDEGIWIHDYVKKNIVMDPTMATALLDMYAKCGKLAMAWEVFKSVKDKKVFTWDAMIGGLAIHGRADYAVELFKEMLREKFKPDKITFVGLLNACAHSGDIDQAMEIFDSMESVHRVKRALEHYGCLIHGLARAGRLREAEELMNSMPMAPEASTYKGLLVGCRIYGNVEMSKRIEKILVERDPANSRLYASLTIRGGKKAKKGSGGVKNIVAESSTIDLGGGCIREFKMGASSQEVHLMVREMIERIEGEGYVSDTSSEMLDVEEEEDRSAMRYHSEKLAIAFGLINTKPGTTIRVVKNLRVCDDCHNAVKIISRVYGREIIVRDQVRYHEFSNGACSCNDFW